MLDSVRVLEHHVLPEAPIFPEEDSSFEHYTTAEIGDKLSSHKKLVSI